ADAQVVQPTGQLTGTNIGASKEPGEPNHAGIAGGQSVWYRFTAARSGPISLDTCGSSFDTLLAVYTGGYGALQEVASNDDAHDCSAGNGDTTSRVTFTATAGTSYLVAVDGKADATGAI